MELYSGNYKLYLILPLLLTVVFLFAVLVFPGVKPGIDLEGGTQIIIRTENHIDSAELIQSLNSKFDFVDLSVVSISSPVSNGVSIQFAEETTLAESKKELDLAKALLESNPAESEIHALNSISLSSKFFKASDDGLKKRELTEKADEIYSKAKDALHEQIKSVIALNSGIISFSTKEVPPVLGKTFWDNALLVCIIALIGIILVIFFFFREFIPSVAVIYAGLFDVLTALALMSLTGIPLGLNSIPALLLLIGYSVDTDILLTTRLLKRKDKTPRRRAVDSMKTGLTMTFTTMAAVAVMLVVSYLYQIEVLFNIAAVLLFGLFGDIIVTWMMNAPILLWYIERKKVIK
ncbi:MAG: protein translocase subunit SecF [archaeon]